MACSSLTPRRRDAKAQQNPGRYSPLCVLASLRLCVSLSVTVLSFLTRSVDVSFDKADRIRLDFFRTLAIAFRMLAEVCSAAVSGIEAYPVVVEVKAGWGNTIVVIVGLPDAAVMESRHRVSTALSNSGFKFPMGRTTINLAPADVKDECPNFDLRVAIGLVAASEQMPMDQLDNFLIAQRFGPRTRFE